jgi:hypothetical protein
MFAPAPGLAEARSCTGYHVESMREYLTFEWRILRTSLNEAWRYFLSHIVPEAWTAFVTGAATIVADLIIRPGSPVESATLGLLAGSLAFFLMLVTVTFAKLFSAPYRLLKHEEQQRKQLQTNLQVLAEKLRPKICATFLPKDPWIKKLAKSNITTYHNVRDSKEILPMVQQAPSWWFRVCVQNNQEVISHGCMPYLTSIEYSPDGKDFESTGFANSQPLRWAETDGDEHASRNIVPLQRCYVDVLSVDPIYKSILMKWPDAWIANEDIFTRHGLYRLTLSISSEDGGNAILILILKWNGIWDQTEMTVGDLFGAGELTRINRTVDHATLFTRSNSTGVM